jgi:hypothetical protein
VVAVLVSAGTVSYATVFKIAVSTVSAHASRGKNLSVDDGPWTSSLSTVRDRLLCSFGLSKSASLLVVRLLRLAR